MYPFWGVHNLYQAKSANSILESKVKLVCFFLFLFSLFVFSFFVIRFRYSFFTFGLSLFAFHICFSLFVFLTQNRAEYRILTFKLRPNIVFFIQNPI